MREILFRGKRIATGAWVYGTYLHLNVGADYICQGRSFNDLIPIKLEVNLETVGQYTGLTDRNGTKIFEGDRCRVSRPCVLAYGKITFQNGCFWFVDDGPGGMLRLCDAKINGFELEIIGNVHDNPELLEGAGTE